jgi:hypothetical protein
MNNLTNRTLLTAITCAWLLTAAVFVVTRPPAPALPGPTNQSTPAPMPIDAPADSP